jgi:hypothetical protein
VSTTGEEVGMSRTPRRGGVRHVATRATSHGFSFCDVPWLNPSRIAVLDLSDRFAEEVRPATHDRQGSRSGRRRPWARHRALITGCGTCGPYMALMSQPWRSPSTGRPAAGP